MPQDPDRPYAARGPRPRTGEAIVAADCKRVAAQVPKSSGQNT